MTFDLNEGHHHVKLPPAVLLTKFGSLRALFNVFDPRGPRGPRTPYPCKTFVATPHTCYDQVWSKSDHECGRSSKLSERKKKKKKKKKKETLRK